MIVGIGMCRGRKAGHMRRRWRNIRRVRKLARYVISLQQRLPGRLVPDEVLLRRLLRRLAKATLDSSYSLRWVGRKGIASVSREDWTRRSSL